MQFKHTTFLLLLSLVGCTTSTSETEPPESGTASRARKVFGGRVFYPSVTSDEINKCNELGDQCLREKVTKSDFCGINALVFLRFDEDPRLVFDCIDKTAQELAGHKVQTPEIKYVFFGDLNKGDTPELIHGRTDSVEIHAGKHALVGLIRDDKGRWFIKKTIMLGIDQEAPKRQPPDDGYVIFDYSEIPTEPEEIKTYFGHLDQFCDPNVVANERKKFLQMYQNRYTIPGSPCIEE